MQILAAGLAGLEKAQTSFDQTAGRLSRAGTTGASAPQDPADFSAEMLNLLAARAEYEINLKSVQTGDEMLKHTIDLLA
jgi:flagellar hook protein FlgE